MAKKHKMTASDVARINRAAHTIPRKSSTHSRLAAKWGREEARIGREITSNEQRYDRLGRQNSTLMKQWRAAKPGKTKQALEKKTQRNFAESHRVFSSLSGLRPNRRRARDFREDHERAIRK